MDKIKVGIIGTGNISGIYFQNGKRFESMEVVACADLDVERAKAKAAEHGIRGCSVEELLADPEVQMIINLTIPQAHASVCLQALEAGKHVYVEKPLAVTREEGLRVLELARSKGLLVGSAPDTFLGAASKPRSSLLRTVGLEPRSGQRRSWFAEGMNPGIRLLSFIITKAAARCSTWVRII